MEHPLFSFNHHDLVPFINYKVHANLNGELPNLHSLLTPRLFATHVPYQSLPESMIDSSSKCKIVYICRNPFDTFVSIWHFIKKIKPLSLGPFSMEEAFDMYCKRASRGVEANKEGNSILYFENKGLFRKDEVGDWSNHITREMVEKLDEIFEEKSPGSRLNFSRDPNDKQSRICRLILLNARAI
ncbi:hypothetical protein Cgig2_010766 [Carnegiea gigantea]|uniref:Sulfotransferase n=1 Tax=Carnegiea gigantea TaxID=171969 RepID=A0A9Q1JPV0_9CARY|nr:hypothetical protein Cgig2_010766 [Carnegiea gigantea]